MIHLMIADDHAIVRDGLRRLLHTTPDLRVAAEVDNGADAIGAAADPSLRVAVIDLSLPHLSGLELVHALHARRPDLRLVVFTMHPEDKLAAHLIRAGELAERFKAAGWGQVEVRYHLFFPRVLARLRPMERYLAGVPLGAQYSVTAVKSL